MINTFMMYYTIYKVTNKINGKFYIGKHQTKNLEDTYYGSGKALKEAIHKYGIENFYKEILFVFDNENEMNLKEKELITEELVNRKDTYNLGIGGEGGAHFKGKKHSKETRKKLAESRKNYTASEETRAKISEGNRRRIISDETRKKLSEKAKLRERNKKLLRVTSEVRLSGS